MSTSFVQVEKLHPTPFEVEYFDQYDFYSLTDRYSSKCTAEMGENPRAGKSHIVKGFLGLQ